MLPASPRCQTQGLAVRGPSHMCAAVGPGVTAPRDHFLALEYGPSISEPKQLQRALSSLPEHLVR